MKRYFFHIESSACSGCKTCVVACKDLHDHDTGINLRQVIPVETGSWSIDKSIITGQPSAYYLSVSCHHCADPACVAGCPTEALSVKENGIVVIDAGVCMGCGYCSWVCPYDAPKLDKNSGKTVKCDLCISRLTEGLNPVCVDACPLRSIHIITEEEGSWKAESSDFYPLADPSITKPSLIVTPHHSAVPGKREKNSKKNSDE